MAVHIQNRQALLPYVLRLIIRFKACHFTASRASQGSQFYGSKPLFRRCLAHSGNCQCCTSGFKTSVMHQSFFWGAAWHLSYANVCTSLVFRTKLCLWQKTKQRVALDRHVFAIHAAWPFHVDLESMDDRKELSKDDSGYSCHLSTRSVLRLTYARCATQSTRTLASF